ncbi:ATP-dependent helicase [Thermodesulfobacteriota bacterium]
MQKSLFPTASPSDTPKQSRIKRQDLNPAQYQAVTSSNGPVLVIAGAGSGKTRTLVYRVAYLVEQGIPPENILLLTFTRKSAQEMLYRASGLLDETCQQVLGGTFHAVANLLLRRHSHLLGYPANFTILDQSDAEGIINLIKSSLNLGGAGKRFPTKRLLMNILSKAVNKSIDLEEVLEEHYVHLMDYSEDIATIQRHYRKFKMEHHLMDYDDLLVNWHALLNDFPATRQEISDRFQYILVDEYQDTNPIQAGIVRLLADPRNNIMAVGDDSQSIYSFRGADFRNIMDFPDLFPDTTIIRLEENYRSTQAILTTANAIIENAREKFTKTLFTNIPGGDKPTVYAARNESEQARFIADTIAERKEQGVPLSEIAVLFRSGFHSYKLELELNNRRILFEKRGGQKLTESAHIKDLLAHFRVIVNQQDSLSWNRILLLLDKIGPKTARTIVDAIMQDEDPITALQAYPANQQKFRPLIALGEMLIGLRNPALTPVAQFDLAMHYYQPNFEKIYHDDYPRRSKDLEQLREILTGYTDLRSFLDDTALDPPPGLDSTNDPDMHDDDRLILSTIHSAKGLEFDTVFIIHLTEGKFPPVQAFQDEILEEERRLFYVAATRAKARLFLTYPREVMSMDRKITRGLVSPFLGEIPSTLLSRSDTVFNQFSFAQPARSRSRQSKPSPALPAKDSGSDQNFTPGVQVSHPFFGEGTVESVAGPRTINVLFQRHGHKTLHLDYAKLEVLGS